MGRHLLEVHPVAIGSLCLLLWESFATPLKLEQDMASFPRIGALLGVVIPLLSNHDFEFCSDNVFF